jgi:hypothetical protein
MSTLTTNQKTVVDALDAVLDSSLDVGLNNPDASVNVPALPNYSLNKTSFRGIFRAAVGALVGLLEEWTTVAAFDNGCSNTGAPWANASYYKDPWGRVYLRGHISGGILTQSIFQLPAGYRPAIPVAFAASHNGSFIEVRVNDVGQVFTSSGAGAHTNLSLDGMSFRIA